MAETGIIGISTSGELTVLLWVATAAPHSLALAGLEAMGLGAAGLLILSESEEEKEPAALTSLLLQRAVGSIDSVNWRMIVTSGDETAENRGAVVPKELFPRIHAAITSVNVASRFINEEEADVTISVLASSGKYCVVSAKLNDVVKLK